MIKLSESDVALVRAAASLAAHAPENLRAGHLALPLEALARRLAAELRSAPEQTPPGLPLAA